jgi:hypothetical protein
MMPLFANTFPKNSTMHRLLLVLLSAALIVVHFVRLELAAKEPLTVGAITDGQSGDSARTSTSPSSPANRLAPNEPSQESEQKTDAKEAQRVLDKEDAEAAKRWSELSKKEAAEMTRRHIHGLVRAAHLYYDEHGSFPPAVIANPKLPSGKQLSGFVLLLPYLKADSWIEKDKPCFGPEVVKLANDLYKTIDQTKAWDDPVNLKAAKTIMPAFLAPQSGAFRDETGNAVSHFAFVRGSMNGPDGAFPGETTVKIADIKDGTAHTLAIGQIINDIGPWMSEGLATARQVHAPTETAPGSFGSNYKSGCYFAMCDSSPFFVGFDEPSLDALQKTATHSAGDIFFKLERISNPFEGDKDR